MRSQRLLLQCKLTGTARPALGQNENPPFSGLCWLLPAADMAQRETWSAQWADGDFGAGGAAELADGGGVSSPAVVSSL
jgi:hypothetical protein